MAREHKFKVGGFINGIEYGEDGTPGVTKDMLDVVSKHHLVEDLSPGEADEGVIQWKVGRRSGSGDMGGWQTDIIGRGDLLESRCWIGTTEGGR